MREEAIALVLRIGEAAKAVLDGTSDASVAEFGRRMAEEDQADDGRIDRFGMGGAPGHFDDRGDARAGAGGAGGEPDEGVRQGGEASVLEGMPLYGPAAVCRAVAAFVAIMTRVRPPTGWATR